MRATTTRSTQLALFLCPLGFLATLVTTGGGCAGEFKLRCDDGSEVVGDDLDACGSVAGAAGAGGDPGGAGQAGTSGGGSGGRAGSGGSDIGGSGGSAGGGVTIEQVSLSTGDGHTCISAPTAIRCWGSNYSGQLGPTAALEMLHPEPKLVESGGLGFVRQVALGYGNSCALRDDGRVLCWGYNGHGELGTGPSTVNSDPHPVPTLLDNTLLGVIRQVAAKDRHTCAVREDGRVLCWGLSSSGRLGVNPAANADSSVPILLDDRALGVVKQVAVGDSHSCALRADGRVLCWGSNGSGQLGNGATSSDDANYVPALIDDSVLGVVRQIALGRFHSCALRDDGRVLCWGLNHYGQVGTPPATAGTGAFETLPKLIEDGALGVVVDLAAGHEHTCATRNDGRVLCWGSNRKGQLGVALNSGGGPPNPVPILVNNDVLGVARRITAAREHTCALRDDGRVLCWGNNQSGQLGSTVGLGIDGANPTPGLVEGLPPLIP